jgi:hypothetical protein
MKHSPAWSRRRGGEFSTGTYMLAADGRWKILQETRFLPPLEIAQ